MRGAVNEQAQTRIAMALMSGEDIPGDLLEAGGEVLLDFTDGRNEYFPNALTKLYHTDRESFCKCLLSPMGSGTTAATMFEAMVVYPEIDVCPNYADDTDRIIRVELQGLIVRDTLKNIRQTILPAIAGLKMPFEAYFNMGDSTIRWEYQHDRFLISGHFQCIGLENEGSDGSLLSLYADQVIISEPKTMKEAHMRTAIKRAGRFRPALNPKRVLIEGNPPPESAEWFYKQFGGVPSAEIMGQAAPRMFGLKDKRPTGYLQEREIRDEDGADRYRCWWYPGADSPEAINKKNLAPGYYRQFADSIVSELRWQVFGMPSTAAGGDRVAPSFSEGVHVENAQPVWGEMERMIVSSDADRTGAAVIARIRADGGILIVAECHAKDIDADAFGVVIAEQIIALEMRRFRIEAAVCDPAGVRRSATDGRAYYSALSSAATRRLGRSVMFEPLPGKYNDPKTSITLLQRVLKNVARGPGAVEPMLRVHKDCRRTISALSSYCRKAGDGVQFDKRENLIAAYGDAVRYLASWVGRNWGVEGEEPEDALTEWKRKHGVGSGRGESVLDRDSGPFSGMSDDGISISSTAAGVF